MDTEFTEHCKKTDQIECNSQRQKSSSLKNKEKLFIWLCTLVSKEGTVRPVKIGWAKDSVKWLNEVSGIERH